MRVEARSSVIETRMWGQHPTALRINDRIEAGISRDVSGRARRFVKRKY